MYIIRNTSIAIKTGFYNHYLLFIHLHIDSMMVHGRISSLELQERL